MSSYVHQVYSSKDLKDLRELLNKADQARLASNLKSAKENKLIDVKVLESVFHLSSNVTNSVLKFVDAFIARLEPKSGFRNFVRNPFTKSFGSGLADAAKKSMLGEIRAHKKAIDNRLEVPQFPQYASYDKKEQVPQTVTGLLRYFYDLNQARVNAADYTTVASQKFSLGETKFNSAFASYSGLHTPGFNSDKRFDRTRVKNPNNPVLAAVFDGVTNSTLAHASLDKIERKKLLGGYEAANALKTSFENIPSLPFDIKDQGFELSREMRSSIPKKGQAPVKDKLQNNTMKFVWDIYNALDFVKNWDTDKSFFRNFYDQYVSGKNEKLNELINRDNNISVFRILSGEGEDAAKLRRKFMALLPLCIAHESASTQFYNAYKGKTSLNFKSFTTAAYAVDLGDKLGLVSLGDTNICTINKTGDRVYCPTYQVDESPAIDSFCEYSTDIHLAAPPQGSPQYFEIDKNELNTLMIFSDGFESFDPRLMHYLKEDEQAKTPQEIISEVVKTNNDHICQNFESKQNFDDVTIDVLQQAD